MGFKSCLQSGLMSHVPATPAVFASLLEPVTPCRKPRSVRSSSGQGRTGSLSLVSGFLAGLMVVNLILVFWNHEWFPNGHPSEDWRGRQYGFGNVQGGQGSMCDLWTWSEKLELAGIFLRGSSVSKLQGPLLATLPRVPSVTFSWVGLLPCRRRSACAFIYCSDQRPKQFLKKYFV